MDLEVILRFPPKIIAGLLSGELRLWGGVVRNAANGQIVALLKEGGSIAGNSNLGGGLLKTLLDASTGGLSTAVTGAVNAAVTAHSHFLIMQQLHGLTTLVGIVGGIGVLNLAVSVISTGILLKRLADLEKAIEGLYEHVSKEFSQDRHVKMEAAIQAATDALNMNDPYNRNLQAHSAIGQLYAARQHIWRDLDTLKGSLGYANNQLMQNNILQAMQLDTLRSRCLLELDEVCRAKDYLLDKLDAYWETTRMLIHRHLGEHRAVYFHKSVRESDLFRYLAIERWLSANGDHLLQIILAHRQDFWNHHVADDSKIVKPNRSQRISLPFRKKDGSEENPHIDALTQSELLIENYRRLQGIHAEIEAVERLGISYSEWEKRQEEALAKAENNLADFTNIKEYDDYVLLVDKEWLAEQPDSTLAEQ